MTYETEVFAANEERHRVAKERGLLMSISALVLISGEDDTRIREEGQNAVDEIAARILAETSKDPEIKIRYLDPRHNIHDEAWL